MKLLWVKSDFLHPTTRGGQIRSLETLKRLHRRHEVHYVALEQPGDGEGVARSGEYSTRAYPVPHFVPDKRSAAFAGQLIEGLYSRLPVAVSRYRSEAMKRQIGELSRREKFDAVVCDFLFPAPNIPDLGECVLFQHNVEATIWRRHAETASNLPKRLYFELQARRMLAYEADVCRRVKNIIAVSAEDAATMREAYGARRAVAVPTGVDLEYFAPSGDTERVADLVFLGSMDWMANIDGIEWFVSEALPLIRRRRPECSVAIVGRKPFAAVRRLGERDARILVTGTVPDVRPYLWGSAVSIVPLRVGGGTRLKIYEAMAAKIPVVSTSIGAEGLDIADGENIAIADSPADFAARCVELLESAEARRSMARAAWEMIAARYSWEVVSRQFEELLLTP